MLEIRLPTVLVGSFPSIFVFTVAEISEESPPAADSKAPK